MKSNAEVFRDTLREYRERIDEALSGVKVRGIFAEAEDYGFMVPYTDAFHAFTQGGKRLRAFLVILGYNMCGRQTAEDIVTASLSYELFQSGILVHDDIIDESSLRRGCPAMHITLGGGHMGESKAICVGDLGIVAATDILLRTGFDDALKLKAIEHQNRVYKLTIAGELKDIDMGDAPDMGSILLMYELKTAWYTFIGPMQLGMILGGGDEELLQAAKKLGLLTGKAFQMRDDILGIFGETDATGKDNLSDIEEGKATVLTAHFRKNAAPDRIKEFDSLYGQGSCDANGARRIRELLKETGAYSFADEHIRHFIKQAGEIAEEMKIPDPCRRTLLGMLEYMSEREG